MSNVKPGDLAFVVGSVFDNNGKVVRVLHESPGMKLPLGSAYTDALGQRWYLSESVLVWEVESMGGLLRKDSGLYMVCPVADRYLRRITPPPGTVSDKEVRELYTPRTSTPCKHKHKERA